MFRSNRHISAQVIDDRAGRTLAAASTVEPDLRAARATAAATSTAAEAVGRLVAERAKEAGITRSCSTAAASRYHGRVAALADAAREAGLEF